jgi:hypothetical protein
MSDKTYIDLLHLTEEQAIEIVHTLQTGGTCRIDERRKHSRLPFQEEALLLCEVKNKHRKSPPFLVKCIDISAGGIGFLHGAYMHTGTPCVITLIGRNKSGFRIEAKVARCQHHTGHIHIIGVKFNKPMDQKLIDRLQNQAVGAGTE